MIQGAGGRWAQCHPALGGITPALLSRVEQSCPTVGDTGVSGWETRVSQGRGRGCLGERDTGILGLVE